MCGAFTDGDDTTLSEIINAKGDGSMKFAFHVRNIAVKDHDALSNVQKTIVKRIISQQTAK